MPPNNNSNNGNNNNNKKKKRPNPTPPYRMYPNLHPSVSLLLFEEENLAFDFHTQDTDRTCTKSYDTNIMARFICNNKACGTNAWTSKKVAITIRMYPGGARYNARVYNQRCRACDRLGKMKVDEEAYAERVAYRIKKWCGVEMEVPIYNGGSKGPHRSSLCEGCKAGHCADGGD